MLHTPWKPVMEWMERRTMWIGDTVLCCCQDPWRAAGKHPPTFTSLWSASNICCAPLALLLPYSLLSSSLSLATPSNICISSIPLRTFNLCCCSLVCRYIWWGVGKLYFAYEIMASANPGKCPELLLCEYSWFGTQYKSFCLRNFLSYPSTA